MPLLTISYQGKTVTIPVTAEYTGQVSVSLDFIRGHLGKHHDVGWTEARCAGCGAPAEVMVTKTTGVRADG